MKRLTLFLFTSLILTTSAVASDHLAASIDAANYQLADVLRPRKTYCGVLVNAQPVSIQAWRFPNLVVGIVGGISNGVLGTRFGDKKLPAWEYVIRLDEANGYPSELVTIIQGGRQIDAGTPVFVTTGDVTEYRTYGVRVIAAATPEVYGQRGLEEARQAALRARK